MVTRRTKYGWMALGGMLCLFGFVLACKVRDGNRAMAQADPPAPSPAPSSEPRPIVIPASATMPAEKPAMTTPPAPAPLALPKPSGEPLPPLSGQAEVSPPALEKEPIPKAPEPPGPVVPAGGPMPPPSPPNAPAPPPPAATTPPNTTPAPTPPPTLTPRVPPPSPGELVPPPSGKAPEAPKPETPKDVPGEPPLAPTPGPVIHYKVPRGGETFQSLAKKTLGSGERWGDIHKLNPTFRADTTIPAGTMVRLPGDACIQEEESIRPLPTVRPRTPPRPKPVLPLTGTFSVTLDDKKVMSLPRAVLEQLGNCDLVMVSPGSDQCLWLTNQAHLDRLQAKLDRSPAREGDVRSFKRLYYAQTAKVPMKDGRVALSEKLVHFAGLGQELVLVGIDDHFEIWDATHWRRYTQTKKAAVTEE